MNQLKLNSVIRSFLLTKEFVCLITRNILYYIIIHYIAFLKCIFFLLYNKPLKKKKGRK